MTRQDKRSEDKLALLTKQIKKLAGRKHSVSISKLAQTTKLSREQVYYYTLGTPRDAPRKGGSLSSRIVIAGRDGKNVLIRWRW